MDIEQIINNLSHIEALMTNKAKDACEKGNSDSASYFLDIVEKAYNLRFAYQQALDKTKE